MDILVAAYQLFHSFLLYILITESKSVFLYFLMFIWLILSVVKGGIGFLRIKSAFKTLATLENNN